MKNTLFLLLLMLCTCLSAQTDSSATYSAKEVELKLESQKIELTKTSIDDKIAAQDKRIEEANDHLGNTLSLLGVVVAILGLGLGFGGYFIIRGNSEAKTKLEREMSELKVKVAKDIEDVRNDAKDRIEIVLAEIETQSQKATTLVDDLEAKTIVVIDKLGDNGNKREEPPLNNNVKREVENIVQEIKELKTKSQYTTKDWFLKGYNSYNKRKFEEAVSYFIKSTKSNDFEMEEVSLKSKIYINWACALFELGKLKKSLSLFEEANLKFKEATKYGDIGYYEYSYWGHTLIEIAKLHNRLLEDEIIIKEKLEKAFSMGLVRGAVLLAYYYSLVGNKDMAYEWVEKGFKNSKETQNTLKESRKLIEFNPFFTNLRGDKRFKELLDKYLPKDGTK